MIGKKKEDLIITNKTPVQELVKKYYNNIIISNISIGMSNFIQMLEKSIDLDLPDIDYFNTWTQTFFSYLLDKQKEFIDGKEINLSVLLKDIENQLSFSKREKQELDKREAEKALWSIFILITEPSHESFKLN